MQNVAWVLGFNSVLMQASGSCASSPLTWDEIGMPAMRERAMRGWRGKWGRRVTGMLERRGLASQAKGEGASRASEEGWAAGKVE